MNKPSGASTSGKKKEVVEAAAVEDFLAPFNAIPGGVSAAALAGASGISEVEAQKRLDKLTEEGKLTAVQPMGGPLTYFLSQPEVPGATVPEGGPPEMGSIDTREDIDTRPLEEQRADAENKDA